MSEVRGVIVTGASSGIGYAIAERLLAGGWWVTGVSRRGTGPDHDHFRGVSVDLASGAPIDGPLREAAHGTPGFRALVSNAGRPVFAHLAQLSPERIRAGLEINLTSHLLVTRALLPLLLREPRSHTLFIGSESALRGAPRGTVYCAAKFGLRGFAEALRAECAGSGMRVTAIHPGMVRTPFFEPVDFEPDPDHTVDVKDIADLAALALDTRGHGAIDEISIAPLTRVVRKRGVDP